MSSAVNLNVGSRLTFPGTDEGRDLPEKMSAAAGQRVMRKPGNVNEAEWAKMQSELSKMSSNSMTLDQLKNAGPNSLGNDPKMEMAWAEKAAKHAEAYFSVLKFMPDKKNVKLTKIDDEIYADFRRSFGKMKIASIDENTLKSEQQKGKWRPFCMRYKNRSEVGDYNFGSLVRLDCKSDYNDSNTTIVPRIQFLAIEIARNREGLNDHINRNTACSLQAATAAAAAANGTATATATASATGSSVDIKHSGSGVQPADVIAAPTATAAVTAAPATAPNSAASAASSATAASPAPTAKS